MSQARFDGCIACTSWPRRHVERLLPLAVELAPTFSAPADSHPVLFMFGELTEGAVTIGGFTVPLGVRYYEFGLAIPGVTYAGARDVRTYVPRMYSSYSPATWIGNTYFGFSKATAKMWWQGSVFLLTSEEGALVLHANVEAAGRRWVHGSRCALRNFRAIRDALATPVVGRRANGAYVTSYFDLDFTNALVRPADSWISIDAPLIDGLTPGVSHDVESGTFEVRGLLWRLSWPVTEPVCR